MSLTFQCVAGQMYGWLLTVYFRSRMVNGLLDGGEEESLERLIDGIEQL